MHIHITSHRDANASTLPPVNGVCDNAVVSWWYLNKGEWPSHQLVIVLHHEVLWAHLQGGHIGVLQVDAQNNMGKGEGRSGRRRGECMGKRG